MYPLWVILGHLAIELFEHWDTLVQMSQKLKELIAMNHHVNGTECLLCRDKLLQADIRLQIWFLKDVKPLYPDIHIAWSYRNEQDQNEAVAMHKSKLKFPCSAHNKQDSKGHPCAKALDLFILNDDGTALFTMTVYQAIAQALDPLHMKWGGTFQDLGDYDHFELI